MPTRRFLDRVDSYRRDVERRRFGGDSPRLRPVGRGRRGLEVAAAVVAAERLRGVLELDGEAISPTEDLAADELDDGLRALANWSFTVASRHLIAAADLALLPRLQQRVSLARALERLCHDVVSIDPEGRWSGVDTAASSLLATLDLVPDDEVAFYREEIVRLADAWAAARRDDVSRAGWGLARSRAAARDGARETELAWQLRLYRRYADRLDPDDYLVAEVRRAEALFRLLLPDVDESARPDLEALAGDAWPADLRPALVAAVGALLEVDLSAVASRFALRIYRTTASVDGGRA
ncbi:MAG TPA: hypothetical protein VFN57_05265 [Thermomicrobiaceae bacterium]|nr:hypothetical protein [Thermomicrobiaceae bacterium]